MSSSLVAGQNSTFGAQRGIALTRQQKRKNKSKCVYKNYVDDVHAYGDVETSDSDDTVSYWFDSNTQGKTRNDDALHMYDGYSHIILRSQARKIAEGSKGT